MRQISPATVEETAAVATPGEIIELHWMTEPDALMMGIHQLPTPTLCGTWMANEAEAARAGAPLPPGVRFIACPDCDQLALAHSN